MAVMFLSRLFSTIFPHPGTVCFWCDGVLSLHYCLLLNYVFILSEFCTGCRFLIPWTAKTMHGGGRNGKVLFFRLQKCIYLMTLIRPHPYAWCWDVRCMEHMIIESKSPLIIHFFYKILSLLSYIFLVGRPLNFNNANATVSCRYIMSNLSPSALSTRCHALESWTCFDDINVKVLGSIQNAYYPQPSRRL